MSRIVKSIETESSVCQGQGDGDRVLSGNGISFRGDEHVLELGIGGRFATL